MLNQDHPDDERISALASHDTDATADATLTAHVASCDRCTELVAEVGALRVALADLPDLPPSRPLQLLPPVEAQPSAADRLGGWARRFFAPVLAAGAAVALVGVVGTAAPALDQMASGQEAGSDTDSGVVQEFAAPGASAAAEQPTRAAAGDNLYGGTAGGESESESSPLVAERTAPDTDEAITPSAADDLAAVQQEPTADRSPWPMVLFAGVALMVAAVLGRWILAPRAG
ncbi:MAG: hypothetical protein ACRDG7_02740 [Candidatus Limnocylindria bacterium]